MIRPLLILFSALLLLPNFINIDINENTYYDHREQFDPNLSYINSIDKLESHIDSILAAKSIKKGSVDYVATISDVLRYRFYHGFSHFTLKENWIAAVAEKIIGYGLASKVKPDDIMHHAYAACSQQAMVMMEIMRRKGITYRSVGFPHHFALEALVNGNWYYFDSNMEPNMNNDQRLETNWGCRADNLKQYYDTTRFKDLDWKFGKNQTVTLSASNKKYAANAKFFQDVTAVLSRILWIFPLLLLLYKRKKSVSPAER